MSSRKPPNKPVFDFFGVPIELGNTVIFADNSNGSCSMSQGIAEIIEKKSICISSDISKKLVYRDPRKIVNIEGFREYRAEWII